MWEIKNNYGKIAGVRADGGTDAHRLYRVGNKTIAGVSLYDVVR
jgi:hypothetical protein